MNAGELKALQAPLKSRYKEEPGEAFATLRTVGTLNLDRVTCTLTGWRNEVEAGLHPKAGGDGTWACSAEMLLEALAACAGVTLAAVATAMQIPIRGGRVAAEGDMDFRGTLGVNKETPIGLTEIRLAFHLETDASEEQLATLLKLTERYCVIFQTLKSPPKMTARIG